MIFLVLIAAAIGYQLGKLKSDSSYEQAILSAKTKIERFETELRELYLERSIMKTQMLGYIIDATRWRAQKKHEKVSS